jgi:hypothetical protein
MTTTTRSRKAAKPVEISAPVIYRCTDRASHETFYLVASDSQPGVFYAVRWDDARARWLCPCASRKPCKHERAINEVLTAKRELDVERARVALPVAVRFRGGDGSTAHLDLGDHREVVCVCDLPRLFPGGYRLVECDDPDRDAWNERMSQLEDRTSGRVIDDAWRAQVRTCLPAPECQSDIVTDDDMTAHIEDSIRSGEFADPNSCRICGALCRGGVCMDCLSIAA